MARARTVKVPQKRKRAKPAPKARTTSTAIARVPARVEVLPALVAEPQRALTEDIELGGLGLRELKLTDAEEAVLSEPVPADRVQVKPQKAFTPYLSHPEYTRWFNRAFGRTGWALRPVSKPMISNGSVVCPYVLHVHGQPVAAAYGEQEFHQNNKDQTYGDALESTVASALRRCAKRLGVGLELWDRDWIERFKDQYAVLVKVNKAKRGEPERIDRVWRLKSQPAAWNEVGGSSRRRDHDDEEERPRQPPPPRERQQPNPPPQGFRNPDEDKPITKGTAQNPGQVERLWAAMRHTKRKQEELARYLEEFYDIKATTAIKRKDFDRILMQIEHPGPLPTKGS